MTSADSGAPSRDEPALAGFLESDYGYTDYGIEDTLKPVDPESLVLASFDSLFLVSRLAPQKLPARIDLHTFAYLGCLMAVYSGIPAHEWGYSFSAVPPTLPYSPTLDGSVDRLLEAEFLSEASSVESFHSSAFMLSDKGERELAFLSELSLLSPRVSFLEAAASAAVFTSTAAVVNSLANEPQLAAAKKLASSRRLLTPSSTARLYDEFEALSQAIGKANINLIVPASMYVSYLQSTAQSEFGDAATEVVAGA